ncbi:uncharacterized protein LOC116267653 [Nymphaea colorata]|uniref:uncharacterized protein LOC116267653 n=1 Tax=Nymphaea colorata TaxID=210225 RepID=UPI00129E3243|nr:uncharacterized protein LOC116267653 [Nymphaea colorata]
MGWISDRFRRHVTFSKRKGLLKKTQESCCLTGATIGVICLSEAGNPFTLAYPPPADGKDGDDGHERLLSIMQQHYDHSGTRLPVAVEESKSILEENSSNDLPQPAASNDSLWSSLEPLHGGGVRASDCVIKDEPEVGLLGQMQSMDEAEMQKSLLCLIHALHNLCLSLVVEGICCCSQMDLDFARGNLISE